MQFLKFRYMPKNLLFAVTLNDTLYSDPNKQNGRIRQIMIGVIQIILGNDEMLVRCLKSRLPLSPVSSS
jgi:hypothetical protein